MAAKKAGKKPAKTGGKPAKKAAAKSPKKGAAKAAAQKPALVETPFIAPTKVRADIRTDSRHTRYNPGKKTTQEPFKASGRNSGDSLLDRMGIDAGEVVHSPMAQADKPAFTREQFHKLAVSPCHRYEAPTRDNMTDSQKAVFDWKHK